MFRTRGSTGISYGIDAAQQILTNSRNVPKAMVVITDGIPNLPGNESFGFSSMVASSQRARNNGTIIYAIGVGPGTQLLTLNAMAR